MCAQLHIDVWHLKPKSHIPKEEIKFHGLQAPPKKPPKVETWDAEKIFNKNKKRKKTMETTNTGTTYIRNCYSAI